MKKNPLNKLTAVTNHFLSNIYVLCCCIFLSYIYEIYSGFTQHSARVSRSNFALSVVCDSHRLFVLTQLLDFAVFLIILTNALLVFPQPLF